jgi:hypothetical protein
MVLTVSFVLAPETGLVVSVASAMRQHCRRLDISVGISGPHDFAVREFARSSAEQILVHRIPRPTSVTIAIRPSFRARDAGASKGDLPVGESKIFLNEGMDRSKREQGDLPVGQITFWRNAGFTEPPSFTL